MASVVAPPYAAMMPAAWLSTMSPEEAARKKTIHRRQNTGRRRSAARGAIDAAAAASVTPDCAISHALIEPVTARIVARPPSVARTPNWPTDQPKRGAAIIAAAGYRPTMAPVTRPLRLVTARF